MTCPVPAPQMMLAVGRGGWSFALAFVDAASNPVDLTAAGLVPTASFYQGNTGTTTALTVDLVDGPNGLAAAIVPEAIVLSTLYPTPGARLLGGLISLQPTPNFRLYAYLIDALGARTAEQIIAVQPVDWRSADPGMLPQPPLTYIAVGPSGPRGVQGIEGPQGIPGGIIPHSAVAAQQVSAYQVLVALPNGEVQPASSAVAAQAGTVVGIATDAASGGQTVTFQDGGSITNTPWSWAPGSLFFDNNAQLTQTPPTGGFVQSVGRVLTANTIAVQLGQPAVIVP